MSGFTCFRPGLKICVASCLSAWLMGGQLAQAQHSAKDCRQPGLYDFQLMSRSAVTGPLAQQARNGQILEQTLWNYHYSELKDDLRSSAHFLLDRLARRSNGEVLELHLQTARDLAYNRENFERYAKFRSDLNRKRVQAIVEYMSANHPDVTFVVRVTDPSPVGMAGAEAAKGYREMSEAGRGILPPELQNYLSAILGGQASQAGGGSAPGAPSGPTSPGGLGAEAVQQAGRPVNAPEGPPVP